MALAAPAHAQLLDRATAPETVFGLALLAILLGLAMVAGFWLARERVAAEAESERLRVELADARNEAEMRAAMIAAKGHRILAWQGAGKPEIVGHLPDGFPAPREGASFLRFSHWMEAHDAGRLETAIGRLREHAEPFTLEIELADGRPLEISGRTLGALALVRFSPMEGVREELTTLRLDHERAIQTIETLQTLFDAAPIPLWLRGRDGALVWVNTAFASAVDAADSDDVLHRNLEFLNAQDRAAITAQLAEDGLFDGRLSAVVEADRRNFHVVDTAGPLGSAGLAIDISGVEAVRRELQETERSHGETLDHLTTAVARFDEKTQLVYNNAAFERLFALSPAYLDTGPEHIAILDGLRSRGVLPQDRPLRELKAELDAAYRAPQPTDAMWHLADGRTLRVFASPEPRGGATWVFEDLTEKFELESRLNALVRLQGETLDSLNEAVAVFGQDGRLRLSNPIFAEMWGLTHEFLTAKPHIRTLERTASVTIRPGSDPEANWQGFSRAVTAFDEGPRVMMAGECELSDGRVHSYGVVPLPNGQTMLTFTDISDARAAERMLRERNEALVEADRMKSDFVQHVNYELRSPLTNIIGFSALLRATETGPLNERQSEYLDYISTSTSTLLTIVNDILDLATIDAGIMDLDITDVDIVKTAGHAADAVRERLRENDISLKVDVAKAGKSFRADEHRVTQVLFNLLSNAANFAPSGSTILLRAHKQGDAVSFEVADEGPGIADSEIEKVFERFEANPSGGRQSGAGLGLSIVKSFVELHGGTVSIARGQRSGTVVTCRFPLVAEDIDKAAE